MKKLLRKNVPEIKGEAGIKINKTIKPIDRKNSNVEVEKSEVVVGDITNTGFPELYIAGGQPHSSGGTPLFLPNNSFVFSKDKSMKIKDEEIQKDFNKTPKKSGYVPADIAKQYDINSYRKTLAEKDSDKLQRDTAEDMIKNYNEKLGKLALVQESIKGMPNGIPFIAVPYLESMGIDPTQLVQGSGQDETEVPTQQEEDEIPQKKNGGEMKIRILRVPVMKNGGQPRYDPGGEFGITPHKSKTKEGKTTPTFANSDSPLDPSQYAAHYLAQGIDTSNLTDQQAQELLYDKADPFVKAAMWGTYGDTKKGATKDRFSQYGLLPNETFPQYKQRLLDKYGDVETLNNDLSKYKSAFADSKSGARTATLLTAIPPAKPQQVIPTNVQVPEVQQPLPDLNFQGFDTQNIEQNNPFWTQDVINSLGAFGDLNRIKKYMPWQAGYNTVLPEATYYDPTRELAANAEQANIGAQASATFAGPQQLASRLSSIQGQGLTNAANILGKYNNLNVGISNQNNAAQTDIINQSNFNRANQATALYDKTIAVNQNFDNAKAMARQNLRNSFIQGWTNRGQTQALNAMNKQYRVDPVTGFVEFTGVPGQMDTSNQTQSSIDLYNSIRNRPGMTDEAAIELFKSIYNKGAAQPENIPDQFAAYQKLRKNK